MAIIMADKAFNTGKMNDEETEVYFSAFSSSKNKSIDGRNNDAANAVIKHRSDKKGLLKAVEGGIKEGSLRSRIKARTKKIDEAF
jgi:hypothetical protein